MEITKTCTRCGIDRPATLEWFFGIEKGKYGLGSRCKPCSMALQRESRNARGPRAARSSDIERHDRWAAAHPERIRAHKAKWRAGNSESILRNALVKTYDLTLAEYDALLKAQGGVCAICKSGNPSGQRLGVDHNHTTGQRRGILCHGCNLALGKVERGKVARRDLDWIIAAEEYLAYWAESSVEVPV